MRRTVLKNVTGDIKVKVKNKEVLTKDVIVFVDNDRQEIDIMYQIQKGEVEDKKEVVGYVSKYSSILDKGTELTAYYDLDKNIEEVGLSLNDGWYYTYPDDYKMIHLDDIKQMDDVIAKSIKENINFKDLSNFYKKEVSVTIYNSIVRDEEIEKIKKKKQTPLYHVLGKKEQEVYLLQKQKELLENYEKEENKKVILADMLSLMEELGNIRGYDLGQIKAEKQKREAELGGFSKKYFLEKVVKK